MSQGQGGGKPRRWSGPEDWNTLRLLIDSYFQMCETPKENGRTIVPEVFGLCVHCKMSYDCYYDYESGEMDTETEKYSEILHAAKMKIISYASQQIYDHAPGAKFVLSNMTRKFKDSWKESTSQELTGPNGGPLQFEGISIKIVKGGDAPGNSDT